jgi:hypothetical protein
MGLTAERFANRYCKAMNADIAADFVMVLLAVEVQPFNGIGL